MELTRQGFDGGSGTGGAYLPRIATRLVAEPQASPCQRMAVNRLFGSRARVHGTQAGRPLDPKQLTKLAAARKWAEAAGLTFGLVDEAVGVSARPF